MNFVDGRRVRFDGVALSAVIVGLKRGSFVVRCSNMVPEWTPYCALSGEEILA